LGKQVLQLDLDFLRGGHMGYNDAFITAYSDLERLCKKRPSYVSAESRNGVKPNAVVLWGESCLSAEDVQELKSLKNLRNSLSHDQYAQANERAVKRVNEFISLIGGPRQPVDMPRQLSLKPNAQKNPNPDPDLVERFHAPAAALTIRQLAHMAKIGPPLEISDDEQERLIREGKSLPPKVAALYFNGLKFSLALHNATNFYYVNAKYFLGSNINYSGCNKCGIEPLPGREMGVVEISPDGQWGRYVGTKLICIFQQKWSHHSGDCIASRATLGWMKHDIDAGESIRRNTVIEYETLELLVATDVTDPRQDGAPVYPRAWPNTGAPSSFDARQRAYGYTPGSILSQLTNVMPIP
jgi:hypothetical protein